MQMRRNRVPGVPHQPDHLTQRHALAFMDPNAARLHTRIHRVTSLPNINHAVAIGLIQRDIGGNTLRCLLGILSVTDTTTASATANTGFPKIV